MEKIEVHSKGLIKCYTKRQSLMNACVLLHVTSILLMFMFTLYNLTTLNFYDFQ